MEIHMTDFTHEIPKLSSPIEAWPANAYVASVGATGRAAWHSVCVRFFDGGGSEVMRQSWTDVNADTDHTRGSLAGLWRILEVIKAYELDIDQFNIFTDQGFIVDSLPSAIDRGKKEGNLGAFNLHNGLLETIKELGGYEKIRRIKTSKKDKLFVDTQKLARLDHAGHQA
jgi:hypothetical protein